MARNRKGTGPWGRDSLSHPYSTDSWRVTVRLCSQNKQAPPCPSHPTATQQPPTPILTWVLKPKMKMLLTSLTSYILLSFSRISALGTLGRPGWSTSITCMVMTAPSDAVSATAIPAEDIYCGMIVATDFSRQPSSRRPGLLHPQPPVCISHWRTSEVQNSVIPASECCEGACVHLCTPPPFSPHLAATPTRFLYPGASLQTPLAS